MAKECTMKDQKKKTEIGVTVGGTVLRMRFNRGTAKKGGRRYELNTDYFTGAPYIVSKKTQKRVDFDWPDLVAAAVAAGIDEPEPKEQPIAKKKGKR